MLHRCTEDCVKDLEQHGKLFRIHAPIDAYLEMAAIHRRVNATGGPALLFEKVKGSPFAAASNLFGTSERARFLFRHTLRHAEALVRAKADLQWSFRNPGKIPGLLAGLVHAMPRKAWKAPVLYGKTRASLLPAPVSWPKDGGPFITLPQVCTLDPMRPHVLRSNLGMYRVQLQGNQYVRDEEVGLHYQIHRGIGAHHALAKQMGKPLSVAIFVGGPPAHAFSAVMPLPEGVSELAFAGVLAGFPFRYVEQDGWLLSADADFVLLGTIAEDLKPEGPFGDHLGYYSNAHDFPYMKLQAVYHRKNAIWPFTVVGRPPQEDSIFGELIHEIASPMAPVSVPGLRELHAVDAAGVHPLALAIGSERYLPYAANREPMELLTIASAIQGFNQVSLSKYLLIAAHEDNPRLTTHNIAEFLAHMLERVDLQRDLHFTTCTTIDTLDYSGTSLNRGSKLVVAAAGEPRRTLAKQVEGIHLPAGFGKAEMVMPGVLAIASPSYQSEAQGVHDMRRLCQALASWEAAEGFPLVVACDNVDFVTRNLENFLWVTFTRSNPSHDIFGTSEEVHHKHWGCKAPLVIDARIKPHHAEALEEDPDIIRRIEAMACKGGALHGLF